MEEGSPAAGEKMGDDQHQDPAPNAAFEPGITIRVLAPMVMRASEDMESKTLGQLSEGMHCLVKARGTGATGRRLEVAPFRDDGSDSGLVGWISCVAKSGRALIEALPPKEIAQPEEPGSRGLPNEAYEVGSFVETLDPVVMRSAEDLQSSEVAEILAGQRLKILRQGTGSTGRRLKVAIHGRSIEGWISCTALTGRALLRSVPEDLATAAPAGAPSPAIAAASPAPATAPTAPETAAAAPHAAPGVAAATGTPGVVAAAGTPGVVAAAATPVAAAAADTPVVVVAAGTPGVATATGTPGLAAAVGAPGVAAAAGTPGIAAAAGTPGIHTTVATPGFTQGDWEYICVDPSGLRTRAAPLYAKSKKTGRELRHGEAVRVEERGFDGGMMWLRLTDGRGWAFERTNRRRMSEVAYEDVHEDSCPLMVNPALKQHVPLATTPYSPSSMWNAESLLELGSLVRIKRKARMLVQQPDNNKREVSKTFLEVAAEEQTWPATDKVKRQQIGWVPESVVSVDVLVEFKSTPIQVPQNWISICPGASGVVPQPMPRASDLGSGAARKRDALQAGDLLEVMEVVEAAGLSFFRLTRDGMWISEKGTAGQALGMRATLEPHWWAYLCNDKDGAKIRQTPTRAKGMITAKTLKCRQRVTVSDLITLDDGDKFIRLGPPHTGWVPVTKVGGKPKMEQLCPVNSFAGGLARPTDGSASTNQRRGSSATPSGAAPGLPAQPAVQSQPPQQPPPVQQPLPVQQPPPAAQSQQAQPRPFNSTSSVGSYPAPPHAAGQNYVPPGIPAVGSGGFNGTSVAGGYASTGAAGGYTVAPHHYAAYTAPAPQSYEYSLPGPPGAAPGHPVSLPPEVAAQIGQAPGQPISFPPEVAAQIGQPYKIVDAQVVAAPPAGAMVIDASRLSGGQGHFGLSQPTDWRSMPAMPANAPAQPYQHSN